jgi:hypothetical protein
VQHSPVQAGALSTAVEAPRRRQRGAASRTSFASAAAPSSAPAAVAQPTTTAAPAAALRPAAALAELQTAASGRAPAAVGLPSRGVGRRTGAWQRTLALVRYSGDWDCDATAMLNLAHQLQERTGSTQLNHNRTIDLTADDVAKAPFLFMTGHDDFAFTEQEVTSLRQYLAGDGFVWVNDSTDLGDDTYDAAVRREFARVMPQLTWQRIPAGAPIFQAPYDLRNGYLGYTVPPGDKYRQDYFEGLYIDGRLTVIYTRNDYGDGLEIDPHTHPLNASLSDLSPAEMQEGSVRMGINIVSFFLNGGQLPEVRARSSASAAAQQRDALRAAIAERPASDVAAFADIAAWRQPDGWENVIPTTIEAGADGQFEMSFGAAAGTRARVDKAVATRELPGGLVRGTLLVMDVASNLAGGARLALAFSDGGDGYWESAPAFIKPGANQDVAFDLRRSTFKSAATEWAYSGRLPTQLSVHSWCLLLYPQQGAGTISISRVRRIAVPDD